MSILSQTQQTYIEKMIQGVPEEYKMALNSFDWPTKIFEIAQKNGLSLLQIEKFMDVTVNIALGMDSPQDYLNKLVKHVGISVDRARVLQDDIKLGVFDELIRQLKLQQGFYAARKESGSYDPTAYSYSDLNDEQERDFSVDEVLEEDEEDPDEINLFEEAQKMQQEYLEKYKDSPLPPPKPNGNNGIDPYQESIE
jgi:hypothetical protein